MASKTITSVYPMDSAGITVKSDGTITGDRMYNASDVDGGHRLGHGGGAARH